MGAYRKIIAGDRFDVLVFLPSFYGGESSLHRRGYGQLYTAAMAPAILPGHSLFLNPALLWPKINLLLNDYAAHFSEYWGECRIIGYGG